MTSSTIGEALTAVRRQLREHPESAEGDDVGVTAVLESGLRVRATDDGGRSVVTDMPAGIGGGDAGSSPGTVMRSAVACCNAALVAMCAAEAGIELSRVEVRVDSTSDDRGMLGEPGVGSAPLEVRVSYVVEGPGLSPEAVHELVEEAASRSPVMSALRNAVTVTTSGATAG